MGWTNSLGIYSLAYFLLILCSQVYKPLNFTLEKYKRFVLFDRLEVVEPVEQCY